MLRTNKKIISSRKNKKSIFRKRWFRNFILFLMFFLSLSWLVLKTPIFEIKKIKIFSSKKIEKGIKEIASKENNFFLFNKSQVSREIKKDYPQIKSVSIKKQFPSTIILRVTEGQAIGIFCLAESNASCFFISEEGVLLGKTKPKAGNLIFISHDLKNVNSGQIVIKKTLFKEIILLIQELKDLKIYPKKIEIFSFEIIITTNKNFKIYFLKNNFKSQVEIFLNIFKKTIGRKEKRNLKYIDLRSLEEGKKGAVYWK